MESSSFNYLRMLRQRHALEAKELAFLINQKSGTAITQYEVGDRVPTLEGAFALEVVFGHDAHGLFPGYFEAVEDAVMRRASLLLEQLQEATDQRSTAKRALLEALPSRVRVSQDAP